MSITPNHPIEFAFGRTVIEDLQETAKAYLSSYDIDVSPCDESDQAVLAFKTIMAVPVAATLGSRSPITMPRQYWKKSYITPSRLGQSASTQRPEAYQREICYLFGETGDGTDGSKDCVGNGTMSSGSWWEHTPYQRLDRVDQDTTTYHRIKGGERSEVLIAQPDTTPGGGWNLLSFADDAVLTMREGNSSLSGWAAVLTRLVPADPLRLAGSEDQPRHHDGDGASDGQADSDEDECDEDDSDVNDNVMGL